jgi:predicted lipoprotein with Yx(FWY)xxD motif
MRIIAATLLMGLSVLAGCGGSDDPEPAPAGPAPAEGEMVMDAAPKKKRGTTIRLTDSQFGSILVDGRRQAIYIFENDSRGKTVCYGECARAWPPVLTSSMPRAGTGVRSKLLGTVRRRNGRRQVTYAGKPLYFYAHEAPGEVLCHNVDLNGGLWWVIGPSGTRRA